MMNRKPNPHIGTYGRPVRQFEHDPAEEVRDALALRDEMISQMPTREPESAHILGEEYLDIEFEDEIYDHDGVMIDDMTLATTYRPVT